MIDEKEEAALNQEQPEENSENLNNSDNQTLENSDSKEITDKEEEITPVQEEVVIKSSEELEEEQNEKVEATKSQSSGVSTDEDSDATDEDEDHEEHEEHHEDYSHYSKKELSDLIKQLSKETDFRKTNLILKEIKPLFDEIAAQDKEEASKKYIADGGEKDGFEYREDELTKQFYHYYQQIQKNRSNFKSSQEAQKQANFEKKNAILEKLRHLTEAEESQASMNQLKAIQDEWKSVGPVPSQYNRSLWASYNALINLFYDQRSIYFELKELDRKKNLATKLVLCEKAEKLSEYESIRQAIKELNDLHEEFKHVGPVPMEEQEALWQRFKAASDKVYEKKRDYIKEIEEDKKKNLALKLEILERLAPYATFQTEKINEWNAKTKEIIEIQKEWEKIRFVPREKIKELNKKFWAEFKTFFNNKNAYIKTLDEERDQNLQLKVALCEEADALVASDGDHRMISDKLKELQLRWKDIGPVPSKQRESIYQRFKKKCDEFFEKRRSEMASRDKDYIDNLEKKKQLCEKISQYKPIEGIDPEDLIESFIKEWQSIGFVPLKAENAIQHQFDEVLEKLITKFKELSQEEKEKLTVSAEIQLVKDSPQAGKKLKNREHTLRKKIAKIENDIDTLNNNMGFLANSKKADSLKESINKQIEDANEELRNLKLQLEVIQDQ